MKPFLQFPPFTLAALTGLSLATSAQAAVLFADTFDRPDSGDLNASAAGKSGTLGALNWVERSSGGGIADIVSNQLRIGESAGAGGNWAIAYPDHNFIDSTILSTGSFTVSLDLVGPINSGGNTRFTGFMVGNAQAEMSGWSSNNPTSTFTSDFFIGYDPTSPGTPVGTYIYTNSTTEVFRQTINRNTPGLNLSVTFSGITDFNSGSTVNYEAFIDGGSVHTGSFTWSGTNENYIGVYSNYSNSGTQVDNFSVSDPSVPAVIPEPSAFALLGLGGITLLFRRRR